jgi:hypothetical protein
MPDLAAPPVPEPVRGRFLGVRVPRTVPFFDCRESDQELFRPGADGRLRLSRDPAALALGDPGSRVVVPRQGIHFPFDARDPRRLDETRRIVAALRVQLARAWLAYRRALRHPAGPDEGGGVEYPPVAVALYNFGASVLADHRRPAVERLG